MGVARAKAAVGFSIHTGWAATVVLTGQPLRLLDRRKLLLAGEEHDSRFVYHVAAETSDAAERILTKAEAAARSRAVAFFLGLAKDLEGFSLIAALPRSKRGLPPLASILKSHSLIHAAEGELYRACIEEAAKHLGIPVVLGATGDPPELGKPGPPWGKDQKEAASLAWAAL